jgi:hypothetical protein
MDQAVMVIIPYLWFATNAGIPGIPHFMPMYTEESDKASNWSGYTVFRQGRRFPLTLSKLEIFSSVGNYREKYW